VPIEVAIADQQRALRLPVPRLRGIVRTTLQTEGVQEAALSVALVDDQTIHALNRRHLGHDYPTDVLSFLLSPPGEKPLEGEVIVSTETAVRQAERFDWSPEAEVTLYLVHGLLHLCGYDDQRAADRQRMRRRERDILQNWGLTPHYER
jgi:probable rRNA maturation factor